MQDGKEKKKDFFVNACIKGADDLRKILNVGEEIYYTHPGYSGNSKNYYIYLVLNELEKAGTALIRIHEFISEGKSDESRLSRNILEAQLDETYLWLRKLTEILTELILFKEANSQDYYRHYILVGELKDLNNTVKNAKNAYGCNIQNYIGQITDIKREINKLETSSVDLQKCWYLKSSKGIRVAGGKAEFENYAKKLDVALMGANADQRIALRMSYNEGFGSYSGSLHFNMDSRNRTRLSLENIRVNCLGIGLLVLNILIECRRILKDRRHNGYVAKLNAKFKNNDYPKNLIKRQTHPNIRVGDFVNAQGELAEVIKVKKGKYGYRSFRLKFLIEEDSESAGSSNNKTVWTHKNPKFEEYPAIWVKKIYDREGILRNMKEEILKHNSRAIVSTKELTPRIREAVIHLWKNVGL